MQDSDWRKRLSEAVEKSDKSMRAISIAAGNGHGYVHSVLKEGKDPTVDNLIRICGVLDVSLTHILYGVDMTAETEEIIRLIEGNPQRRAGILQILKENS